MTLRPKKLDQGVFMKKVLCLLGVSAVLFFYIGISMSVPPGKILEFKDGKMGKITFSGQVHKDANKKCDDCHEKLFKKKHGTADIGYKDHKAGIAYCFACHNNESSFGPTGNCRKCHKKE